MYVSHVGSHSSNMLLLYVLHAAEKCIAPGWLFVHRAERTNVAGELSRLCYGVASAFIAIGAVIAGRPLDLRMKHFRQ